MIRGKFLLLLSVPFILAGIPGAAEAAKSGKIYFTTQAIKDRSGKALKKQFAKSKPSIELKRNKDKSWDVIMVAFLKRKSYPGPITLWFYDKADKAAMKAGEVVHVESVDAKPTKYYVHSLLIDPSRGFNKTRTYVIKVGQILGKRNRVYAVGEVVLKP